MSSFEEIRSDLMKKYNVGTQPEVKTGNEEFDRIRAELMAKYSGGTQQKEAVDNTVSQQVPEQPESLARKYARMQHGLQLYDSIGSPGIPREALIGAVAAKPAVESALIGGATLSGRATRMVRTSQAEAKAKQAQQAYDDYVAGQEYQQYLAEQRTPYIAGQGAAMTQGASYAPGIEAKKKTTADSRAERAEGLKAVADYYENRARMARDNQTLEDDMEEFRSWPEEDRAALVTYVINSNRENYELTMGPQLNGALAQASGLVNKYGLGKVRQMAESYSRWENARTSEAIRKNAEEAAKNRPGWSSVGSVAANALGNYTGIGGFAGEMAVRTGRYSTLDPNNIGTMPGAWAGTVRQTVAQNIEGENGGTLRKAASMGYQAFFSAADNLARMFMGGEFFGVRGGSLALAATGSFGQTMADASRQGASPGEAAGLSLASSFFEVLTEKVSIDNLLAQAAGGKQSLKQIIKSALKAGGVEMTEEGMSFALNQLADNAILQGDSSVNRRIGELMVEEGMSYREAKETAAAEIMLEAGETLIVSGLSGGMMSGGTSAITNTAESISERQRAKWEKELQGSRGESMILEEGETEGLSLPTPGVRIETTDRVKQKFIDQAGRLSKATGREIVFYTDEDSNQNGYYRDGTIYVNTRSRNAVAQIVSHELTHSTEFADSYGELARTVFNRIEAMGADLKTLRKEKTDLYARHGVTLRSQAEVDQEIVAEFVERYLLTDEATILDVVSGNRTLGERIKGWLDGLLAKLGGKKAEERVFLENARNLWSKALEQSRSQQRAENDFDDLEFAPWNPEEQTEYEIPEISPWKPAEQDEYRKAEFAPWSPEERGENGASVFTSRIQDQAPQTEDDGRDETLEWARQMFDAGEWTEEEYDAFLDEYALPEEELGAQFSISRTEENQPFVIADRDILNGVTENDWISTVKENLKNKFPNGVTVGRNQIRIDKRSREELTYSGYMRWLKNNDPQAYQDKLRATDNADEILLAATDWINESPSHSRRDRIADFGRGTVLLRIGGNDYRAKVVVGTESDGKMRLYDILDMQRTQITEKETDAAIAANPSPGAGRNTASVSGNSVAQPQNPVNPQFSISDTDKRGIASDLRDILSRGGNAEELRQYISRLEQNSRGEEETQVGAYQRDREAEQNEPRRIVQAAKRNGISVEEYLRQNWEQYDVDGQWNSDARTALDLERRGRRYSISEGTAQDSEQTEGQSEAKTAEQIRAEMPAKARSHLMGTERKLLKTLGDVLTVSKFHNQEELQKIVREIADTVLTEGRVSDDQMDFLFDRGYAGGIVADARMYDQYKDVASRMRTNAVTLSRQDQSDIADFKEFRKRAFGTLKIVNQGGLPVDSAYRELQEMAPELFPDSITHPADQLMRMYEVGNSIRVSEVSLRHHWGPMADTYRGWARNEFGEKIGEVIRDLRDVKEVAEEAARNREQRSEVPTTAEEAKEVYKNLKKARRDYEKVRAKTLLTERAEQQVGRLLRGEILLEDLDPETDNVRAIAAVYEAKQEYERINKLIAQYKKNVRAQRQERADSFLQNAINWKDKRAGIAYSRETMERNIYDIVPDRAEAEAVIREYFSPVHDAEAAATRFKNQLRDKIRNLNLSRKVQKGNLVSEAHAVQLLGEAEDNIRVMKASRGRLKQRDGKTLQEWQAVIDALWDENPGLDQGKIRKAVAEFRGIYDTLFEQMNEVRVRNGYEPVNYRQGYFPHFQPGDGDGVLAHFGKVLGIDTQVAALPTSINGLTHTFKPGIQWFGNAQERLGFNTAYDAVEGFDKYLEGVASVIFQTDNIQNLRALESRIRYQTTDDGIRAQVDAVNADDRLTEEGKRLKINEIYENGRYTLSNFVTEVSEYTNLLANKKSRLDRTMEAMMGRRAYTIMKAWESRAGANMIAGNISSALTNFIPMTQAGAQLGSGSMLQGMWQTLKGYKADDGIPGMSTFLTNRRGSDPLVKTWTQNVSDKIGMSFLMDLVDGFTSESILRAAYIKNLKAGLSEGEALHQADLFASSVMADRSKGAMPTLFESSNPIFKMFTQFQLEVNNQYSEVFKDLPRRFRQKGVLALTAVYFKYFLGAFLFNELYEFFAGRRPALDPIGILNDTVGDLTGYELPNMVEWITGGDVSFETEKKGLTEAGTNLAKTALGELPFSSGLTMLGIETDGGRIPASSAVPDLTALWQAATEEDWSKEKRWKEASDELWKLAYIIPPFGGNQAQKIWKGTKAWLEGGSYSVDKDGNDILQYPVYKQTTEEKFWNLVRAAFLGKSSLPEAQDWVESGFDSLGAKQTATYQELLNAGASDRGAYELLRNLEDTSGMKGLEKKQKEALILAEASMTDEEKKIVVGYLLGTEIMTEAGNPTEYARFLMATERGLSVDDYMDLRASGIDTEKILKATDAGATMDDAVTLTRAMAELEPEAGADDVSDLQKWRLCIDSFGNEAGQLSALRGYMTESQFSKVQTAHNMGVKSDTYIDMRELLPKYDADGNGSLTQKETKAAIDSMKISNDQKAVLWQLATGAKSAKNNPYSQEIGQEVLDAMA